MNGRSPWMKGAGHSGEHREPSEVQQRGDLSRNERAAMPAQAFQSGAPQLWFEAADEQANIETVVSRAIPSTSHAPSHHDDETVVVPSPTGGPQTRRTGGPPPRSRWALTGWKLRVVFLAVIVALVGRAAMASAAFMSPGGDIIGWSKPLPTQPCLVCTQPTVLPGEVLTPEKYAETLVSRMTLDQQLGQMLITQFTGYYPSPDALRTVSEQGAGGVLYFGGNISAAQQVTESTRQLQAAASIPLIVSVDQEGGPVNRFKGIEGDLPSASSLTSSDQAHSRGAQDATYLAKFGFNVDLAPVADVKDDAVYNVQFAGRTFGSEPTRVASFAGAYLDGLQEGSVTACVKHFPGGFTSSPVDPHTGLPTLSRSIAEWTQIDLAPYRELLAHHDVRLIMVSHEMIPDLDKTYPTSLSPALIDGILRQQMGYSGVVMTDSLYMNALAARWSVPQAAVLAVRAGADMMILPGDLVQMASIKAEMKKAISDGRLSQERIALSAQRIIALKIKMGLIPMPLGSATPTPSAPQTPLLTPTGTHIAPTRTTTPKPVASATVTP